MTSTASLWPHTADFRGWLALLADRGDLRRVKSTIDADQDVAAVLHHADGRYAVAFDDVRDAAFPLVGNSIPTRRHLALALDCTETDVVDRLSAAFAAPRSCREVGPDDAPVFAQHRENGNLLGDLPLPVQHEHDGGRYFTSAVLAVRDPRTGKTNLSINRLHVVGPRELRALMLPGRLGAIFAEHEATGHDLPVAVCVGADPTLLLASQAPAEAGLDDLEVASALAPRPLPVTQFDKVPTPVPAGVEMVLTGMFRAGQRAPEGPFGEYPRTYGPSGQAPVLDLTARWTRTDPCLQTVLSGGREHFWLGGLPREARLFQALRAAGIDVAAVRLTEGGSCRLHAVIALRSRRDGTAQHAAMIAFTTVVTVKLAVVVDDDIDIFDTEQVEWAVATRLQPNQDLLVVPRTIGSSLDPSTDQGTTAKLCLDATTPTTDPDRFAPMRSVPHSLNTYLAELEG